MTTISNSAPWEAPWEVQNDSLPRVSTPHFPPLAVIVIKRRSKVLTPETVMHWRAFIRAPYISQIQHLRSYQVPRKTSLEPDLYVYIGLGTNPWYLSLNRTRSEFIPMSNIKYLCDFCFKSFHDRHDLLYCINYECELSLRFLYT